MVMLNMGQGQADRVKRRGEKREEGKEEERREKWEQRNERPRT